MKLDTILTITALMAAALCLSFVMALGGEPSSVWLWHTVLGVSLGGT